MSGEGVKREGFQGKLTSPAKDEGCLQARGILVDYEWCSGCMSCVVACQMEHGFASDRSGVVVREIGPWCIEGDTWQDSFVPSFTDECDLCARRLEAGKRPTCVHHCQARVRSFGNVDELASRLALKPKQMLVVPA